MRPTFKIIVHGAYLWKLRMHARWSAKFFKVIEIPESRRFQMVVGIWKCLPFGNRHLKMLKFLNSLTFTKDIINFRHQF